VFEHLDNDQAADAISELEDDLQADVLDDLTDERASDILEIMDPDDAADIIGDLPYDKAEALLRLMGVKEARQVRKLLGYREKTAGGIMTPEVTTVTEDMTVQQVVEHLRGAAAENENIYYIYVIGPKRVLEGVVSLRDLIVSEPDTLVGDIVEREVFTVGPDDDQEDVAELMGKYDLLAIPVVDEAGRILGMVTVDDALDVLEEESAEDLELATGARAGERLLGLWRWVSRNGWLIVWALLFVAAAAVPGGGAIVAIIAVALGLVVLRVSEDVASHAMSRVIGSEEDTGPGVLVRRLAQEALAGLGLGLVVGLLAAAVFGIGTSSLVSTAGAKVTGPAILTIAVGAVYGLAVLLTVVSGTVVGYVAQLRAASGKRVSGVAVSLVLATVAVVWFAALLTAAWVFVLAPVSGTVR
jgi:Mg2+ transporter MgtE